MKILLLTHSFNSLAQRLWVELRADGHDVSLELDIADSVTEEAAFGAAARSPLNWQPDVLVAPFLKRRIPASVWSCLPCFVVHPGPPGDQGPSALDWAVSGALREWGVTVLQATADFDAGPVWAWHAFALRDDASKSSIYRHDVVHAALQAVRAALDRWLDAPHRSLAILDESIRPAH
jgi:putative two-component system protein, hydrogenase maturation factor HypX/HoxX